MLECFKNGFIYGLRREKPCLRGFAKNTGADQPAHPRSLISAFVIHFLESSICKLATGEISTFLPVTVAEETGLKLALSETIEVFSRRCPYIGGMYFYLMDCLVLFLAQSLIFLQACIFILTALSMHVLYPNIGFSFRHQFSLLWFPLYFHLFVAPKHL